LAAFEIPNRGDSLPNLEHVLAIVDEAAIRAEEQDEHELGLYVGGLPGLEK